METNVWYVIAAIVIVIFVGAMVFTYRPHAGSGTASTPSMTQVPLKPAGGANEGGSTGTSGLALPGQAPAAPAQGTSQ
jgi:hypothetical protein